MCNCLFRDDLLAMEESGLLKLFTAFSRDQQDKMYICRNHDLEIEHQH